MTTLEAAMEKLRAVTAAQRDGASLIDAALRRYAPDAQSGDFTQREHEWLIRYVMIADPNVLYDAMERDADDLQAACAAVDVVLRRRAATLDALVAANVLDADEHTARWQPAETEAIERAKLCGFSVLRQREVVRMIRLRSAATTRQQRADAMTLCEGVGGTPLCRYSTTLADLVRIAMPPSDASEPPPSKP